MTNLGWRFVEVLALQLAPAEREIALGDLLEMRATAWRGTCEIAELAARRQSQLWRSWRPWLAAPGMAFPCSLILLGFSFAISMELRECFLSEKYRRFPSAGPAEAEVLCQIVVLLIGSWTAGFTVESLSRRTFAVSAACCFLPCLSCLMRFHNESLSRYCLLLFLLPGIAGVRFSRRGGAIRRRWAIALALAGTIPMAVLAARGNFWVLNWGLVGPAWYLAVRPSRLSHASLPEDGGTIR